MCREITIAAAEEQQAAVALLEAKQPIPEPSAVKLALAQQHLRVLQALPPLVVLGNATYYTV